MGLDRVIPVGIPQEPGVGLGSPRGQGWVWDLSRSRGGFGISQKPGVGLGSPMSQGWVGAALSLSLWLFRCSQLCWLQQEEEAFGLGFSSSPRIGWGTGQGLCRTCPLQDLPFAGSALCSLVPPSLLKPFHSLCFSLCLTSKYLLSFSFLPPLPDFSLLQNISNLCSCTDN